MVRKRLVHLAATRDAPASAVIITEVLIPATRIWVGVEIEAVSAETE